MTRVNKLSAVLCLGSAIAWLGLNPFSAKAFDAATAGVMDIEGAIAQSSGAPQGYNVIHVNARSGNDVQGNGSQLRPYKTITEALRRAPENTLILLAAGVYSTDSGETFPLRLKSRVTIQGMSGPNTADVSIVGNGNFNSTKGIRNVTIVGEHNAGLANITVSNPHPEGTGLWIESGNPIILNNAFYRSGLNGIYIAGSGAPVIRGNYFTENGRAGLVIAGPSSAQIHANFFENTGTGITVAPEATPQISENRISRNRDGLVVHSDARPVLHQNQITQNRRNSIIDYATWVDPFNPATGATQPPPPNREVATLASTTTVLPVAASAETTDDVEEAPATAATNTHGVGAIDAAIESDGNPESPVSASVAAPPEEPKPAIAANESVATTAAPTAAPTEPLEEASGAIASNPTEISFVPAAESPSEISALASETIAALPATLAIGGFGDHLSQSLDATAAVVSEVEVAILPAVAATAALSEVDLTALAAASELAANQFTPTESEADAAVPSTPEPDEDTPLSLPEQRDEVSFDAQPEAVSIPIIPPPVAPVVKPTANVEDVSSASELTDLVTPNGNLPGLPEIASGNVGGSDNRLSVPDLSIPVGSGGTVPEIFTTGAVAGLTADSPPPPPSLAASLGLHFKVLVATDGNVTQADVRAVVPDAFRTRLNGRSFIQAGAYPTQEEAQILAERLNHAGLPAQVEEIR